MSERGLEQARAAMVERGTSDAAVATFERFYRMLESGEQGLIPEASIDPLTDVPTLDGMLASEAERRAALARVAIIKLNGGLGTSMGLSGPKTALTVRGELTFLDIIARQTRALCFFGFDGRLDGYSKRSGHPVGADTLEPVSWPADPELEWCPPGHGDVFVSLQGTGLLDDLRAKGIRYVFLSNADNLGATCDPDIAAWLIANDIPYAAEVCERTANSSCATARWSRRARKSSSRTTRGIPSFTPTICGST